MKCPKCQYENIANAKFCGKCGFSLEVSAPGSGIQVKTACSKCGAVLKPGAKFCTKCGTPILSDEPESSEETILLYEPEKDVTAGGTVILNTGNVSSTPVQEPRPLPPVISVQDDIVPPVKSKKEKSVSKKEKSGTGLIIAAVILGIAVIVGIVAVLAFFLPHSSDTGNESGEKEEFSTEPGSDTDTENLSSEEGTTDPMRELLTGRQYTELIDTLLAIDDVEFYSDEDNMREYMRQALEGHMNTAIYEAEELAANGDFDGAYAKLDAEAAYRSSLRSQGRVYPFTEETAELDAAREQLDRMLFNYVSQNTQTKADQRDLAGMEAVLGQASGRLSDTDYNRISIEAYKLYVIRMVDQMQADGQSPYNIMNFIDSYFELTNYHGYMMELWDNQNAQSGRVGTWETSITHADSNGILLTGSDGRYINKIELANFSNYELYLARWEIYARHNRIFVDQALNTYFSKYSWYHGEAVFSTFDDSSLNEYEKGNIKTIIAFEKECGYR